MRDRFPDMAAKRAELTPDKVAFIDQASGRRWTFREVDETAGRVAAGFAAMGLNPGDRLGALTLNCVEFFVALFACQKSGVVLAPLNWRQPVAELLPVAEHVGLAALLHDGANGELATALAERLGTRRIAIGGGADATGWDTLAATAAIAPRREVPADETWYLLFTSGTTGLPKAVIQTARMAWANAINSGQAIDLVATDRSVCYLPLFHTAGINLFTMPVFLAGGTSTVLPKFDVGTVLRLMRDGEVTQFLGVPAIYQAMSLAPEVGEVDWSGIHCTCGGAPLPEPLIRFFLERGARICNGFGMTETGPTTFLMDKGSVVEKIGSVGKAQMMTEVRIDGVPDGGTEAGELLLRGPNITPGYHGNEAATRAAFTEDGWLRTGDVARRDADGYVFIVDRIKDMYISGGENVYPAEVERAMNEHPDILEAAVVGVPDDRWGEVGAAFLVARPGHEIAVDTLNGWCRERLAAYKVPKSFHVVGELPRTAAGKVRKPDLKASLAP